LLTEILKLALFFLVDRTAKISGHHHRNCSHLSHITNWINDAWFSPVNWSLCFFKLNALIILLFIRKKWNLRCVICWKFCGWHVGKFIYAKCCIFLFQIQLFNSFQVFFENLPSVGIFFWREKFTVFVLPLLPCCHFFMHFRSAFHKKRFSVIEK